MTGNILGEAIEGIIDTQINDRQESIPTFIKSTGVNPLSVPSTPVIPTLNISNNLNG